MEENLKLANERIVELENVLYAVLKSIEVDLDYTPNALSKAANKAEGVLRRRNDPKS